MIVLADDHQRLGIKLVLCFGRWMWTLRMEFQRCSIFGWSDLSTLTSDEKEEVKDRVDFVYNVEKPV